MGREIRMVPCNWRHPRDERGDYIPLSDDFKGALAQHEHDLKEHPDWFDGEDGESAPDQMGYVPEFAPGTCTHFQIYETVSEGTPVSPPMPTHEALARWMADNPTRYDRATYDQWLAFIRQGWAPSLVYDPKRGLRSGVESCSEREPKEQP